MRFSRGFTLVELLVVMAIISIMTGVLFVSLSGSRTKTTLKAAAREVAAAVRMAQSNALAGVKDPGDSDQLCFHRVKRFNNTTYRIYVNHLRNSGVNCDISADLKPSPYVWRTFSLKNGVTFSGAWSDILFRVPRGNLVGGATQAITLTKGGEQFSVCVAPSGVVTEVEGVSCP